MVRRRTGAQDAEQQEMNSHPNGGNDLMSQFWAGRSGPSRFRRWAVVAAALALAVTVVQPIDASSSGPPPKFGLPWAAGTAWRLTGGPHSNTGAGRPWSSIDFEGPVPGKSYPVRAVAGGTVVRPCANWVQIYHGNGWETSYYHLINIDVRAGQHVQIGQLLGYTSKAAGCGGSATGAHVHFSIKHDGQYVNIRGFTFGGWKVVEGAQQYEGCLVRDHVWRCASSRPLMNYGPG